MKLSFLYTLVIYLMFSFFYTLVPDTKNSVWEISDKGSTLYLNDIKVFNSKEPPLKVFPENISKKDRVDFALYVAEYYLNKNDKENVANLLFLIRSSQMNMKLLDVFINSVWLLDKNDKDAVLRKWNDYIKTEEEPYFKSLAEGLKKALLNSSIQDFLEIDRLECLDTKEYYTFCRVLKLKSQIEKLEQEGNKNYQRDYVTLERALVPFLEEKNLSYIYFLDRLVPNLAPRLAYLGMAREAALFQKNNLLSEKLSSFSNIVSYERLSYYYLISGDLASAEESLKSSLSLLDDKPYLKNIFYLRLGAIAYYQKKYEEALQYYLSLNFQAWNKNIPNPFTDQFLTINSTRELIAIFIWKSRSPSKAIEALTKIKSEDITENDLFVKLRIAQIMMPDRPGVSQNLSNEIIYQAQSKGWKRLEYAATIMNGYCHLITKDYRKSVIQFTKSYGILGDSDPKFSSEWLRKMGLMMAHSRKMSFSDLHQVRKLMAQMLQEGQTDDSLMFKNYVDEKFNVDSFIGRTIELLHKKEQYQELFDILYDYNSLKLSQTSVSNIGILQIPNVDRKLKQFKSFQPTQDTKYSDSSRKKARELQKKVIEEDYLEYDKTVFKRSVDPFVAALPYHDRIYIFSYDPLVENQKWSVKLYSEEALKDPENLAKVYKSLEFLQDDRPVQIYLNKQGVNLLQHFSGKKKNKEIRFFYTFQKSKYDEKDLNPVIPKCSNTTDPNWMGINVESAESYAGKKNFKVSNRLQVWDMNLLANPNSNNQLLQYEWSCEAERSLSFLRLSRRMDIQRVPSAILVTQKSLPKPQEFFLPSTYMDWADFWMKRGVSHIFYVDRLEYKKRTGKQFVSDLARSYTNPELLKELISISNEEKNSFVILEKYMN